MEEHRRQYDDITALLCDEERTRLAQYRLDSSRIKVSHENWLSYLPYLGKSLGVDVCGRDSPLYDLWTFPRPLCDCEWVTYRFTVCNHDDESHILLRVLPGAQVYDIRWYRLRASSWLHATSDTLGLALGQRLWLEACQTPEELPVTQ